MWCAPFAPGSRFYAQCLFVFVHWEPLNPLPSLLYTLCTQYYHANHPHNNVDPSAGRSPGEPLQNLQVKLLLRKRRRPLKWRHFFLAPLHPHITALDSAESSCLSARLCWRAPLREQASPSLCPSVSRPAACSMRGPGQNGNMSGKPKMNNLDHGLNVNNSHVVHKLMKITCDLTIIKQHKM